MSGYSRFGVSNPITLEQADPVQCCLPGAFLNCPDNTLKNNIDACPLFMAQRCAGNWDDACDAYLFASETDMGGFAHVNKRFLNDVAKLKFCHTDTKSPGSHCALKCESFDPVGQTSPQVCEWIGTNNWFDTKTEYNLAADYIENGRLNTISPLYMGRCPEVCDANNDPAILGADSKILNYCFQYGGCSDTLMKVAQEVTRNNTVVGNADMRRFIEVAKNNVPFNPNVAINMAATNRYVSRSFPQVLNNMNYNIPANAFSSVNVAATPASYTDSKKKTIWIIGIVLLVALVAFLILSWSRRHGSTTALYYY